MNNELFQSFMATGFAMFGVTGALFVNARLKKNLASLIFAALGVLIAVTVFEILPEAKSGLSWSQFLISTLSGVALFWIVSYRTAHICPSCSLSLEGANVDISSRIGLLLLALALHSALDGVALVTADAMNSGHHWSLLIAVSFHKLPEGLALGLLLLGANYSTRQTLFWAALVEGATVIGALIAGGWILLSASMGRHAVLAHIGGGFLYLTFSTVRSSGKIAGHLVLHRLLPLTGAAFILTVILMRLFEAH